MEIFVIQNQHYSNFSNFEVITSFHKKRLFVDKLKGFRDCTLSKFGHTIFDNMQKKKICTIRGMIHRSSTNQGITVLEICLLIHF